MGGNRFKSAFWLRQPQTCYAWAI